MYERLVRTAEECKSILCFGVDPDLEKIKKYAVVGTSTEDAISDFFEVMIDKLLAENTIAAIKPNYAFFAQHGFEGLRALGGIMSKYRNRVPIILDAKRGDIGKTGEAYAREIYDFWGADATTVSPYMGSDSVAPFLRDGKLAYVLCRTSNPGGADFQELKCNKREIYEYVAAKAMEWKNCGLVVGATSDAINKIAKITDNKVPMLIPGIGAQGGDLKMVMDAIRENPRIHRINASSSIAYAYEKAGGKPEDAALAEAQKLNAAMRNYL